MRTLTWIIVAVGIAAATGCGHGPRSVTDPDPADKIPAIKAAVQANAEFRPLAQDHTGTSFAAASCENTAAGSPLTLNNSPCTEAVASGSELEPGWGDLANGLGEDHGVDRAAEDSECSAVREQQPLVLPDR